VDIQPARVFSVELWNTGFPKCRAKAKVRLITAVSELLYPGTTVLEWNFPQVNATLHDPKNSTVTLEPL
jgi:hypothetical protein